MVRLTSKIGLMIVGILIVHCLPKLIPGKAVIRLTVLIKTISVGIMRPGSVRLIPRPSACLGGMVAAAAEAATNVLDGKLQTKAAARDVRNILALNSN